MTGPATRALSVWASQRRTSAAGRSPHCTLLRAHSVTTAVRSSALAKRVPTLLRNASSASFCSAASSLIPSFFSNNKKSSDVISFFLSFWAVKTLLW